VTKAHHLLVLKEMKGIKESEENETGKKQLPFFSHPRIT
jgi:hypothetical protein